MKNKRNDKQKLTLQTPESFWRRFRVAMKVNHEVTAIHPDRKTVEVRNLNTGIHNEIGLELGIKGSIAVNDRMETSVKDIYAVGNAVQVKHYVTGEDVKRCAKTVISGRCGYFAERWKRNSFGYQNCRRICKRPY